MEYKQFKKTMGAIRHEIILETITQNRESIRIKKEKTVLKNLDKIFKAALKISNKKGFQAMSMRDLRQETGISLGALYAYFSSKDDLLSMLQHYGRKTVSHVIELETGKKDHPLDQLKALIRTHIYMSEMMQPWFYFSFMEAKNLNPKEKKKAIQGDLDMGNRIEALLNKGNRQGVFACPDIILTAEMIKAQMTHWYLKRSKFKSHRVTVDSYTEFVLNSVEIHLDGEKQSAPASSVV